MRSKAHFKGHPIHPALVHFPLAFLTGAFGFDLAARLAGIPQLWTTGAYLAGVGIVTALVAAVPGLLDYLYTVPPKSSAKHRATLHMVYNLSAVLLFALGWALRGGVSAEPGLPVLVAEALGTGLLVAGGYLGGILVSSNQIGIDHRYAGAGRWREAQVTAGNDGAFVAATENELQLDQMKLLHLAGQRIVLARTKDGYAAFDDYCTHRGGSLADGVVMSGTVQCPWHGSQFDVRTGAVCGGPAEEPIRAYRVVVRGAEVLVEVKTGERPGKTGEDWGRSGKKQGKP